MCGEVRTSEDDMSFMSKLRVLLVCISLEIGVLGGIPIRPKDIEDLLRQMNQPQVTHVLPAEHDNGDDATPRA
jgi:hypothetical protein